MLIRRAASDDTPAILRLVPRLTAFQTPKWREPTAMTATDLDVIAEALRSAKDDPAVFVADMDGDVAGFIHLRSMEDYYRRRLHGHVADLVVAKAHEGTGVAKALLAHAEEWTRVQGYDWLTLGVFEENRRAENLYRNMGFARDVIRMLKEIPPKV